jgi:HAD superfamily hydrolase (TIGR01490 family)
MMRLRLAVFDLDGTLIAGDSLLAFVRYALRRDALAWRCVPPLATRSARFALGRETHERLKEACLQVIDHLSPARQQALVDGFLDRLLAARLRASVAALVARHAETGEMPVLVSASPDLYVAPLGARLGFEIVLSTPVGARPDGGRQSAIVGANCKGAEKVAVLERRFGPDGIDWRHSFAYGDAWSDHELLERVGHPRPVHPKRRLRRLAAERGWPIIG